MLDGYSRRTSALSRARRHPARNAWCLWLLLGYLAVCPLSVASAAPASQPIYPTNMSLFYHNSNTGAAAVGWITPEFQHQTYRTYGPGTLPTSWSPAKAVSTPNGILLYDPYTGAARIITINAFGDIATLSSYPAGTFWPFKEAAVWGNTVLLYDPRDPLDTVVLGEITPAGTFTTLSTYSWESRKWSTIVGTPNGFLFYNASGGNAEVWQVSNGMLWPVRSYPRDSFAANWWHIVYANGYLIYYSPAFQSGAVGRLDANGIHTTLWYYPPESFGMWREVVPTARGVLFYAPETGRGAVVEVQADGQLITRTVYPSGSFAPSWHVVCPL
ncbi:MAG TPA: hypothetical protein VFS21_37670 [Roseiflexaceae bacterium]|nr:hypothetical protein [Roseiflexaceae bacterium]